jgi:hypothetical protein
MSDALKTLAIWLNVPDYSRRNPGIRKLAGIDALNILTHRPRVYKRVVVYDCDAIIHTPIDIGHVRDFVDRVVVVNVGDLDHANAGVGHVHVLNVARTGAIPRNINFAWGKREPSDWL